MENNTPAETVAESKMQSIDDLVAAVDISKVTEEEIVADIITGINTLSVRGTFAMVNMTSKPLDETIRGLSEAIQQLAVRANIGLKLLTRKKEAELTESDENSAE